MRRITTTMTNPDSVLLETAVLHHLHANHLAGPQADAAHVALDGAVLALALTRHSATPNIEQVTAVHDLIAAAAADAVAEAGGSVATAIARQERTITSYTALLPEAPAGSDCTTAPVPDAQWWSEGDEDLVAAAAEAVAPHLYETAGEHAPNPRPWSWLSTDQQINAIEEARELCWVFHAAGALKMPTP